MPGHETSRQDPRDEFIDASVWHGALDRAKELGAHPDVRRSIYTAALLGDCEAVARFLAIDPATATVKGRSAQLGRVDVSLLLEVSPVG
jgi:hypothetical protein